MTITDRLDRALTVFNEAKFDPDYDMFGGEPRPGRTADDLAWTAGPCSDNPRKVKMEGGRRVDGGPALDAQGKPDKWTIEEVWGALAPVVKKLAKRFASGGWTSSKGGRTDPHAFADLVQNAALKMVELIAHGDDESRIGNSFQSWIRVHLRGAARGGIGARANVGPALGFLRDIFERNPDVNGAKKLIDSIPEQFRMHRPKHELFVKGNKYGEYAPALYGLADRLFRALEEDNKTELNHVKQEAKKLHQKITDESVEITGAATGLHDLINRPHSGEMREKFRQGTKVVGMEVRGPSGDTIERPDMPAASQEFSPEDLANKEVLKKVLQIMRHGYEGPEGTIKPLDDRRYRIFIRVYGIADYPDRGTENDPEFNPARYQEALEQMRAQGRIEVAPVSIAEAGRLAELANVDEETYQQILDMMVASEQGAGDPPVVEIEPENEEQAEQIAQLLGYSPWVRAGSPPLDLRQINKTSPLGLNLGISDVRMSRMYADIGKPEGPTIGNKATVGKLREIGRLLGPKLIGEKPKEEHPEEGSLGEDIVYESLNAVWSGMECLRERFQADTGAVSVIYEDTCRAVRRKLVDYLESLSNSIHDPNANGRP